MPNKSSRELRLVGGREPLPTLEVHIDSVEEQGLYFGLIVSQALSSFATKSPSTVATVYSYGTMSVNFHDAAWSEFLIVAGNKKVFQVLKDAFASYPKIKSRYSDYIAPSDGRATYHIEGGRLWEAEDPFTWYSADHASEAKHNAETGTADEDDEDLIVAPDSNGDAEDVEDEENLDAEDEDGVEKDIDSEDDGDEEEDEEDEDDSDDTASVSTPAKRKGRLNVARADAKISTIRRKIEKVFGLPEGSVVLCGPDKKSLKGNARIKTLRRRWEES